MPLLEKNKLRAEVTFGSASFITGQSLHGTVTLHVLESVILRAVRATHVVVEHVRPLSKREYKQPSTSETQKIIFDKKAHEAQVFLVGSPSPAGQSYPFTPGVYTFPFAIEIPEHLPPSMPLTPLGNKRFGAQVQHTLRIDATICGAFFNFSEFHPVRVVNACPAEKYCAAQPTALTQDAPAHSFMRCSTTMADLFPSATYAAEQSQFLLTVPRPIVSLADDGFLSFQVTGLIPCRYEVRLHRCCTVQWKKKSKTIHSVVARTLLPPLALGTVAEAAIPLDTYKMRGIVNMSGQRLTSVQHYVSIHLLYDRGVWVDINDKLRAKVPVVVVPSLYNGGMAVGRAETFAPIAAQPAANVKLLNNHDEQPTGKWYGSTEPTQQQQPVLGQVLSVAPTCSA